MAGAELLRVRPVNLTELGERRQAGADLDLDVDRLDVDAGERDGVGEGHAQRGYPFRGHRSGRMAAHSLGAKNPRMARILARITTTVKPDSIVMVERSRVGSAAAAPPAV